VTTDVASRWGRDLLPAGLVRADVAYDHLEVDQMAPTALARGLATLAKVPERAPFGRLSWSPAGFIDEALRTAEVPARDAIGIKAANGNGAEPKAAQ